MESTSLPAARPCRRSAPFLFFFAVSGVILLTLAGCSGGEEVAPTIEWAPCEGLATLDCGTLAVPIDHEDPSGPTFDVPVLRAAAFDPSKRIGSLVLNPGGPGGSGVRLAKIASLGLPPSVRDRFDIVGFDPRGEASSTPAIDCLDDLGPFVALDTTPDSSIERAALVDQSAALAKACAARSGDILGHVGANDIVRDMDLLREALGDEKLTYLGYSYGTFLGAIYADTFPDRVRALVLDGALDPALTNETMIEGQSYGFEVELEELFKWCDAATDCGLTPGGGAPGDSAAAYDMVQAAIEAAPMPAPFGSGRAVGPGEFAYGVAVALYGPSRWPDLADALALAKTGDGTLLLALSDSYVGRHEDGTYDNGMEVYYAVTSLDMPSLREPAEYAALTLEVEQKAPRIGAYLPYTALPSALWPVLPWREAGPVTAEGAPPILVVGGTRDPATPYAWAQAVTKELPGAGLLTRDGDGHTSFLKGNSCIDDNVIDYLVNLKLPPAGTICPD